VAEGTEGFGVLCGGCSGGDTVRVDESYSIGGVQIGAVAVSEREEKKRGI
jgi:hypothetical protein